MRRSVKIGVFATAITSLGITSTLMAYAGWAVPSQVVDAHATAGRMPPGLVPDADFRDGHAVVTWTAQELRAGVRMQRYTVTAHSVDVTPRADVAHTVDATGASVETAIFTSAELGGGKWKWAITPRFETWVGAEGRLSGKVSVPAPAPGTVLAGAVVPGTASPSAPDPTATPAATTAATSVPTSPSPPSPRSGATTTPGDDTPPGTPPPTVESAPGPDDLTPTPTQPPKGLPSFVTSPAPPASAGVGE